MTWCRFGTGLISMDYFLLISCLYSCFKLYSRFAYYFPLKIIYSQIAFYTKSFILAFSIDVVFTLSDLINNDQRHIQISVVTKPQGVNTSSLQRSGWWRHYYPKIKTNICKMSFVLENFVQILFHELMGNVSYKQATCYTAYPNLQYKHSDWPIYVSEPKINSTHSPLGKMTAIWNMSLKDVKKSSMWPSDAIWRYRSESALTQAVPDGTKPVSEPK